MCYSIENFPQRTPQDFLKKFLETKMLRITKILFYLALIGFGLFLYWFVPKYSYVQKNPGFCANLTEHLYYCGSAADLNKTFNAGANK